ncbi:hypothetical protein CMO96_00025 [Candidatus Woesebacteria bacterium]|nr:hypothetical protein [Candidatus Woesebacteria bacterium]
MRKYLKYITLIVSLFVIVSVARSTIKLLGKDDSIGEAQKRVEELEREQAELLELREQIESEEFVEREARERLGLAKEDEVVVVLPEDDVLRRLAPPDEEEEFVEEAPIWKRWTKLFFN